MIWKSRPSLDYRGFDYGDRHLAYFTLPVFISLSRKLYT